MFFGLAILASLLGYAFVDPFNTGADDNGDVSGQNDGTIEETGTESNGGSDLVADTLAEDDTATGDTSDPDVTEETAEPEVAVEDTLTVIDGSEVDDLIYGGDGDYNMYGRAGDDTLHGGDGSTNIYGDDGDDRLYAGDGIAGISSNTLNGGAGDDTIYGSNEAENSLNGDDGDDVIHMRGHDTATGGTGQDSFLYSTEYGDGSVSTITDFSADEDQIIVEHATGIVSDTELHAPEVTIKVDGDDAVICLDGNECIIVQGAATNLTVADITLRANPDL